MPGFAERQQEPGCLASPKRTMAWADMVSDESDFESGPKLDSTCRVECKAPSEEVQGSGAPSHSRARGGVKRGRGARRGRGSSGNSEDRSESCKRWAVASDRKTFGTGESLTARSHVDGPPDDGLSDEARWAVDLSSLAEQLRILAAGAPPAIDRCRPLTAMVATDMSLHDVAGWEEQARGLHQLQEEATALEAEAIASEANADAECEQHARLRAQVEAETEHVAASASESQAACLAMHLRLQAALARVAQTLDAGHKAASEAAVRARRREAENELALGELRTSLAGQALLEKAACAEHERAVASSERVRELPAMRAKRDKAKARAKCVEADCEQLRSQAEALRLELDAPHKNSEKAEELEERVRRLERDCRDLHEGSGAAQTAEPSVGGVLSDSELSQSKNQNEQLLAEVREVRQARDEAAAAHLELCNRIPQLQSNLEVSSERCMTNMRQAVDKRQQTEKCKCEAAAERQASAELDVRISLLNEEQASMRLQLEKVNEVIAEKRAQFLLAEKREAVKEREMEKICAHLKEENPDSAMVRCLNAARFKAKSEARALCGPSQANVC